MIDPEDPPRHLDGSNAVFESNSLKATFQHGSPHEEGVNGCRVEDVVDMLVDKLLDFQGRSFRCAENETALYHLGLAREALAKRRKLREQQGVYGFPTAHKSD